MTNVFVLCTGRNGSVTFSKACALIENFTSGHETRCRETGSDRVAYPDNHIEIDNRLSFFLGALNEAYGDRAVYIHLRRNPDEVSLSYNRRWHVSEGLMKGWGIGIARQRHFGVRTARFMVDTIEQNIQHFLQDKTNVMTIELKNLVHDFPQFLELVGANGDHQKMNQVLNEVHNPSAFEPDESNLADEEDNLRTLERLTNMTAAQRKTIAEVQTQLKNSKTRLHQQKEKLSLERLKRQDLEAEFKTFKRNLLMPWNFFKKGKKETN